MRFSEIKNQLSEGWNTGNDRVSLPDTPHTYWSGTGALQKEYDVLYNELVPSQGKADTIEGEVLRASSKIVYRHYNDGDEFNEASFDQLEPYIGTVTSYDDLAHKAIEFALKANGNYTPNPDWDCLDVMDYGPAEEDDYDEDDDYGDDGWPDDDEEVDEGRGPSKGLHKKVTIVNGRDAGKTGYVRQIKTDKLRNRVYLDLDLEDGGQAVVLKQDVRLVKEVDDARTTWNNDFYVYDPKTKTVKKKFRTHKGAKQYAEANGLKVASAEYYHDTVSKEVDEGDSSTRKYEMMLRNGQVKKFVAKDDADAKRIAAGHGAKSVIKLRGGVPAGKVAESWESGPEERTRVERDPDAEYDARRQEKLDAPYAQKEPEAKGYHVVSLDTRQPVTDKVFPTKGHAMAYIQSNYGKNLAYRAINEHWDQEGYDPRGQNPELAPGQKALKGKPVKAKDAANLAQDALTKAFGGTSKDLTSKLSIRKGVAEGIESTDPVEGAVLAAVQELIQQGHTEVAPEVITNMVVAATSQPFLLKDLVDANNNSAAVQHYIDSINPTKVKFSNEILTVKNEDPMKDKKSAQAGVSSMAARAASRNRLGENSELNLSVMRRLAGLEKQRKDLK